MKRIIALMVLWCVLLPLVFIGCNKWEDEVLDAPQNLRMIYKTIEWDEVQNASGYLVIVDGSEYTTQTTYCTALSLEEGREYSVSVIALGDEITYFNSPITTGQFTIGTKPEIYLGDTGLLFIFNEQLGGYTCSQSIVNLKGVLEIPAYINGVPVKEIADRAFCPGPNPNPFRPDSCNTETTELILPNTLIRIGEDAFGFILNLKELVIPDSVTDIDSQAFKGCSTLHNVVFSKNLKVIGTGAFQWCALEQLDLPEGLKSIGGSAFACYDYDFDWSSESTRQTFSKVVFPKSLQAIGSDAFSKCRQLSQIDFLAPIVSVSMDSFSFTPWYDENIDKETVIVDGCLMQYTGSGDANGVYTIPENVIPTRNSLKDTTASKIVYSHKDQVASGLLGSNINIINQNITEIILPEDMTVLSDSAFSYLSNLKKITLPKTIKKIGNFAFRGCSALKEIELPVGLEEIGGYAFSYCTSLEEIVLPKTIKKIGNNAFAVCTALKEIELPTGLEEIGRNVFSGCYALEKVVLPTGLKSVDREVFRYCTNLKYVVIPNTLEYLGENPLRDCTNLDAIYFCGDCVQWDKLIRQNNAVYSDENFGTPLSYANVYFYTEEKPAAFGYYWHYVDGEIVHW